MADLLEVVDSSVVDDGWSLLRLSDDWFPKDSVPDLSCGVLDSKLEVSSFEFDGGFGSNVEAVGVSPRVPDGRIREGITSSRQILLVCIRMSCIRLVPPPPPH